MNSTGRASTRRHTSPTNNGSSCWKRSGTSILFIPENDWKQKRSDMHEYHIDTFVMGDDWKGKFDFLKEEGVEIVYLPRTPEVSSSKIKHDLYDAASVADSVTDHSNLNTDPE